MSPTIRRVVLIASAIAAVAIGGWLVYKFLLLRPTPVTVGEGSILIITHSRQPFFDEWDIIDGAGGDWKLAHTIEAKKVKLWKSIAVNASPTNHDCKKDACEIVATYSDGTIVTLSQTQTKKGMRLHSTRVLGDYTHTPTTLTYIGNGVTLVSGILTITPSSGPPQAVDLCVNVAKCQASVGYEY